MTTLSKVGNTIVESLREFKDSYCPDGQFCENLFTIGGLVFMFWFMYIAMLPIM